MTRHVVVNIACVVLFVALVVQAGSVRTKERKDINSQPKSREAPKAEATSKHTAVTSGSYVPVFVPKHLVHKLHTTGASAFASSQEAQDARDYDKENEAPRRQYSYVPSERSSLSRPHSPSYHYVASPYDDREKDAYSPSPPTTYQDRPDSDHQREYSPVRLAHTEHQPSTNSHYESPRYHATAVQHSQEVDDYGRHLSPNHSRERYTSSGQVTYVQPEEAPRYHRQPADESSGEAYDTHGGRDYDNRHRDYHYVPKVRHSSTYGTPSLYHTKGRPEHHEVEPAVYSKQRAEVTAHHEYPARNNEALVPSLHSSYPVRGETSDKLNTRGYGQYGTHTRLVPLEQERMPQHYDSIAEGNPYLNSGKTYTAVTTSPKYSHDITYPSSSPGSVRFDDVYAKSLLDASQNKHGDSSKSYYGASFASPIGGRYLSSSLFDGSNAGAFSLGSSGESVTAGDRNYYRNPLQSSDFSGSLDTRFAESLKSEYGGGTQVVGPTSMDRIKPYTRSEFLGSSFESFAKSFLPSSSQMSFDDSKYGQLEGSTGEHSSLALTSGMRLGSSYNFGLDDYSTSASKHVASTDASSPTDTTRRVSKDTDMNGHSASRSRTKRHTLEAAQQKLKKVVTSTSSRTPTPAETAAASRFLPMSQPFSSQEFGYTPFFDGPGGSSPPFSSTFSYPDRGEGKEGSFGGISFGRSSPAFHDSDDYGYGPLGSGNFEVIRGGIYSNGRAGSNHVPYYMHGPGSFSAGNYGYEETEPTLGFQGFEHFGNPLHNALSKQAQVVGSPSEKKESTDKAEVHSDHLESASQLIQTNNELEAAE